MSQISKKQLSFLHPSGCAWFFLSGRLKCHRQYPPTSKNKNLLHSYHCTNTKISSNHVPSLQCFPDQLHSYKYVLSPQGLTPSLYFSRKEFHIYHYQTDIISCQCLVD